MRTGDWNRGARPRLAPKLGPAALLFLFCVGCTQTALVESAWPEIELPPRPVLAGPDELTYREKVLANYAVILEVRIDIHNEKASAHNKENGY